MEVIAERAGRRVIAAAAAARPLALLLALVAAACGAAPAPRGARLVGAPRAGALAVAPDGVLLVGLLASGRILSVPPGAARLRRLDVATGGQRGLLGLAADRRGRVFAAYTRARDRRIVVERIAPGAPMRVWTGPPSTTLANGGHLELAPDGRLVIGIGDLQDPARVADPRAPNGKLLALDPATRNRRPAVLSSGWNNPFAFTFTPDGRLWVADNAPGRRPERIARGDLGGPPRQVSTLDRRTAPSGLAAISDRELALCGFVTGTLDRYRLRGRRWRRTGTIARGCRYGVARLAGGRLAFSTGSQVRTVAAR